MLQLVTVHYNELPVSNYYVDLMYNMLGLGFGLANRCTNDLLPVYLMKRYVIISAFIAKRCTTVAETVGSLTSLALIVAVPIQSELTNSGVRRWQSMYLTAPFLHFLFLGLTVSICAISVTFYFANTAQNKLISGCNLLYFIDCLPFVLLMCVCVASCYGCKFFYRNDSRFLEAVKNR